MAIGANQRRFNLQIFSPRFRRAFKPIYPFKYVLNGCPTCLNQSSDFCLSSKQVLEDQFTMFSSIVICLPLYSAPMVT